MVHGCHGPGVVEERIATEFYKTNHVYLKTLLSSGDEDNLN